MIAGSDKMIRVLLVDDHPMLREGVSAVVEFESDMQVVAQASTAAEAIEAHAAFRPDVTLMDIQMPGRSGIEAVRDIRTTDPNARIIMLTTYSGDSQALRAMRNGASGYLLKSSVRKELIDAIRIVHGGRRYLPQEIANEIALHAIDEPLSEREVEILQLVAGGNPNKQIAYKLSIAEETVKAHLKNIFLKLDATDRTHAVTVAAKRGIIEL